MSEQGTARTAPSLPSCRECPLSSDSIRAYAADVRIVKPRTTMVRASNVSLMTTVRPVGKSTGRCLLSIGVRLQKERPMQNNALDKDNGTSRIAEWICLEREARHMSLAVPHHHLVAAESSSTWHCPRCIRVVRKLGRRTETVGAYRDWGDRDEQGVDQLWLLQ